MSALETVCTVCMENILDEKQLVRPCGHMMCVECDASWRSRGKIEKINLIKSTKTISVYTTVSGCPSCRRKDVPSDYSSRSKESLFHEIQMLSKTLHENGIKMPNAYVPYDFKLLSQLVVTPPPKVASHPIVTPYIPPAPVTSSAGICCRKVQQLGCYTTKTKLRCGRCNRFLCRSCRGTGCVCI